MDCGHTTLSYGEFSERLHLAGQQRSVPLDVSIELTERCNLGCAHCYINAADDAAARTDELGTEAWCGLFDQLAEAGVLWMLMTGGEPLRRKDFAELYLHAKRCGILVSLFTNGTLITPEIADLLAEYPPFLVEVSIYGASAATYERVTGQPGSFERCQRGIELLQERGVPLRMKTVVLTLNRDDLPAMQALADELGVEFRFDPVLNQRLDGGDAPASLRLSPEQVLELDRADPRRVKEWKDFNQRLWGPPQDPTKLFSCGAGLSSFHIDAQGRMYPCMMVRDHAYDLRAGSVAEGWKIWVPEQLERRYTKAVDCQHCDMISLCGQCPGWALLEHGDPEKPVDYLCRVAHLRAEAVGPEEPRRS